MSTNQEASAVNAAIADPVPRIQDAPETTVELFRGVLDPVSNEWETLATVRELTGEDEEILSSMESDDDYLYAKYMSSLLKRSVVSIGNVQIKNNPSVIDNLIIGDRDTLFLATVRATYGEVREYQMNCPHCEKSNDVYVEMSEFPVRKGTGDPKEGITVTLRDGTEQKFRLVSGADTQFVITKAKTLAEQNTILISRCAIFPEGTKPKDVVAWAKKLGMKDRATVIDKLLEAQPGPEIKEVDAHCAHCEKQFPVMLNWASLLFG
jgi:hypothetical protein